MGFGMNISNENTTNIPDKSGIEYYFALDSDGYILSASKSHRLSDLYNQWLIDEFILNTSSRQRWEDANYSIIRISEEGYWNAIDPLTNRVFHSININDFKEYIRDDFYNE